MSTGTVGEDVDASRAADEPPLRAELFSITQLEEHAATLARWHEPAAPRRAGSNHLLERLDDNEAALRSAHALVADALERGRKITPAAEWFIDNYHLIEAQVRIARLHLPRGYNRELPRLANTHASGSPRVYDIAEQLISHSHGRVDLHRLRAFVDAYQRVVPLKIGELWAIPIMLRLALLENLRRVVARVVAGRRDRERGQLWAERLLEVASDDPPSIVLVLADLVHAKLSLTDPFVTELASRLQGHGSALAFPMSWLEQRLAEQGQTTEHVFVRVSQDEAAAQVAVSNSIGSLRSLAAIDWRDFVEAVSVVERVLEHDPVGVYASMDFGTRDRYRHVIEEVARRCRRPEPDVAEVAVTLARGGEGRSGHLGWFLVGGGRATFERRAGVRPGLRSVAARIAARLGPLAYLGAIALLTGLLTAWLWTLAPPLGPVASAAAIFVLALCTSQLAIAFVHWAVCAWVEPALLPRLDFSRGIPSEHRTLVAVPILLSSNGEIDEQLELLEVRFLANRDTNLFFALVSDFRDAPTEHRDGDDALLQRAVAGIAALNRRHGPHGDDGSGGGGGAFLLLHRARRHNSRERVWMGWERKRGKLEELNAALRGDSRGFSTIEGPLERVQGVRYVIALDADTELPRDTARMLAATLAHPLNRPVYDPRVGRVTSGYSILQPRVGVTMASSGASRFAALFGGEPGIDPYTRAVSDVYQDLFAEGSFVGKGIYDVDAVMAALGGRLPENRVLSHDLLEGAYSRSGLVSDVMLFEHYPTAHAVDVSRRHRWMRGDWQLTPWLGWRVPAGAGATTTEPSPPRRRVANPITLLSKWKLVDNLRRSLLAPASVALLIGGWLVPGLALPVTLVVVAIVLIPGLLAALSGLLRRPDDLPWRGHLIGIARSLGRSLLREAIALASLPFEAWLGIDAIARTLVRVGLTRRKLLEWRTAADAQRSAGHHVWASYRSGWASPAAAVVTFAGLLTLRPAALFVATPMLLAWFAMPLVTWWISQPLHRALPRLVEDERVFLGAIARRTWRFFETFVAAPDHDLPPDNFQEDPPRGIAHRTSPTNIGLALTANLAAHDFGFVETAAVVDRTRRTLTTLAGLERHRGHFFNWYDTTTLQPLAPLYVSTVDSGNLSGHLLTLAGGLDALVREPVVRTATFAGLVATLDAVLAVVGEHDHDRAHGDGRGDEGGAGVHGPAIAALVGPLRDAGVRAGAEPSTLTRAHDALLDLRDGTCALQRLLHDTGDDELRWWGDALAKQRDAAAAAIEHAAPWVGLLAAHRAALGDDFPRLDAAPSLAGAVQLEATLDWTPRPAAGGPVPDAVRAAVRLGAMRAQSTIDELQQLATLARGLADAEYDFLYDHDRHLLAIGYNLTEHRLDASFYDLLASEARLASFVAIAYGKLPQEHWFSLGRVLTSSGGRAALLSWSGSMFEYLMPVLIMPTYPGTLLDETCRVVVARQIEYGRALAVPWGISESGYNKTDALLNYQYQAFGVPGLGFKRGLGDELVIAPYATVMALMIDPHAACNNLRRLARDRQLGAYGFYEAIDYTDARLPPRTPNATVRSFMAHHQGMSLLSLAYVLCDRPMQRRFTADLALRSTELLLQERVPRVPAVFPHPAEVSPTRDGPADAGNELRFFTSPSTPVPEVHLLSNGRYHVMVTNAGGGYSRWGDVAVTRWREDPTRDAWGTFLYLRDIDSGDVWSAAHQPTLQRADHYEAIYSHGRAEFRRRDGEIETHVEISVSPEDDAELRRISITNLGQTARTIEVTSYAEVVLATPAADAAHPAFSNLFVQTELVPAQQAILCTRRPRSAGEQPPWMLHLMTRSTAATTPASYESSRAAFIGRCRTAADPIAMHAARLTDSAGAVLDPIVAIRNTVAIGPRETVRLQVVTGVAGSRDAALTLVDRYADGGAADRLFELSFTHSQVEQRRLGVDDEQSQAFERLASHILYSNHLLRAPRSMLARNLKGQAALWAYGISGDLPIVLVRIGDLEHIALVWQIVKAHAYWRAKGLVVDVVIWNEDPSGYRQELQQQIMSAVGSFGENNLLDRPGGIFVRRSDQLSELDGVLIQSLARAILVADAGSIAEQVDRRTVRAELPRALVPGSDRRRIAPVARPQPPAVRPVFRRPDLTAFNGIGGFTNDGREYVITTQRGAPTPAPWCNVLANPWFGTVVGDSGGAYTWCENAHSHRLTPWHDDPVTDASGEALYLRDEHDGHVWSPTLLPAGDDAPYLTRHGFGYTVFEHTTSDGITTEVTTFVATDAPIKFLWIKLRNASGRPRRLSLTAAYELVLGVQRAASLPHVVTEVDPRTGAVLARNGYDAEFADRVAFLDASVEARSVTGDRSELLGRNNGATNPAAMGRSRLSGRVGAGYDPCMAMQIAIDLADGQEREVAFTFGSGRDRDDALALVSRFRGIGPARAALTQVWDHWGRTLGRVHVQTPDPKLDFLANGWLLYQVLAARMWARSGFYQSGGAFGFRDQLQDAMALVHAEPALLREQIVRCAGRQFREGDVQHWWHPPLGRGVRTRISDDYLWLPYATCRYVAAIGDTGLLDVRAPFLEGRTVNADEDSYYDLPLQSEESATVYEHCVRAIEHGLRVGAHGLPLMGTGDWNDGMNLVGEAGRGESVWLAFFLHDVLVRFAAIATSRGDDRFAARCITHAAALAAAIEAHGWDGAWYRRAYDDDGVPLGSASNAECQIDSLPQSWAALTGVGDPARTRTALDSLDARLVRRDLGIIALLDPPFDAAPTNPGYIKGYVPGVRENGGQYTHAAVWAAMAFAAVGDATRAWELFDLVNPLRHGDTAERIDVYKVEPYVAAADVYSNPQHAGRGGWTWYTGSAGWMYRLITESLLGIHLEVDKLRIAPVLAPGWTGYVVHYRHHRSTYHIRVNARGAGRVVTRVTCDGEAQADLRIPLHDDDREHTVEVDVGVP
jgi:cyclic beta-1,2-glucan synthetase